MNTIHHFMVVDDDRLNNMVCKMSIEEAFENADIQLFTKPQLALQAIETANYEAVTDKPTFLFLDINMPVMNGWKFLEIYKDFSDQIHKQFTIYILSSSLDHRDKARANSNPYVAGFISKPLEADDLKQIITGLVV